MGDGGIASAISAGSAGGLCAECDGAQGTAVNHTSSLPSADQALCQTHSHTPPALMHGIDETWPVQVRSASMQGNPPAFICHAKPSQSMRQRSSTAPVPPLLRCLGLAVTGSTVRRCQRRATLPHVSISRPHPILRSQLQRVLPLQLAQRVVGVRVGALLGPLSGCGEQVE